MDWECTAGRCSGQEDGTDHAELVSSSKRRGHHAEAAALSGSAEPAFAASYLALALAKRDAVCSMSFAECF